ncbi:FRG domain-containing protein (plasmid) [Pantoea allii]|uniref:FRG domain-containing protein n=1 Tax=Pantoea allii TaxID=574096 RepID=UPI003977AF72
MQTNAGQLKTENKTEQVPITHISQFIDQVLSKEPSEGEEFFYRGHSDSAYKLEPSLFRRDEDTGNYPYRRHESDLITELLAARPEEFIHDRYMLDKLVRMQHYGLPTRLLDVTSNPLIALYFACSRIKKDSQGSEIDGSVVIITAKNKEIKFFDSDTVSCIANISRLPESLKFKLQTRMMTTDEFKSTEVAPHLLHFIRDEKSHFKDVINPSDLNKILLVKGRLSNERISSQSGAFLLFGDDTFLPETGNRDFTVRRLIIRNKTSLLGQLNRLGINESTVFPGIEKVSSEIVRKYARRG